MRAAGGTSVPLMFDWLMWLSIPNVNAEWEKPVMRQGNQVSGRPELQGGRHSLRHPQGAPYVKGTLLAGPDIAITGRPASDLG